jgi:non-ribosomal peptide synthetase component F
MEYMAAQADRQIEGAMSENERLAKENAALLRLMTPGLHVYAGNYVAQIDAGKLGLFTERFTGEDDKPRALRVVQQAAIAAATVGANKM